MAFEPGSPLTLQVGNDPDELAALLPPRAGQRFEILTSRREDAHRLIPEGETVRQANAERFKAERHLHLLQAPASERGNSLPSDDIHCVVARRQLEKLTNAARVLQERYATRGEGFLAIARVHTDAMAWISHGQPAGTIIEDAAEVKLNGKMPLLDQLANVRRRGRELAADLNRIRSSCYPSDHCKRRMVEIVHGLAERGRPSMTLLVEHDHPEIGWPQTSLRSADYNAAAPSFAAA